MGRDSDIARDVALTRAARRAKRPTLVFDPAEFARAPLALPSPAPALPAASTRDARPLDDDETPPAAPLRAAE
jgi:hypothetical protein